MHHTPRSRQPRVTRCLPVEARLPLAMFKFRKPCLGRSQPALVRGCGQAYALQTVEPVTYRCGTRRVCQARSSGSERDTRARPHAVAPMNCVPEDSRRRSTCTGRTHSPRGHCQLVVGSALLPREIDASDRSQQAHVTASHSTNGAGAEQAVVSGPQEVSTDAEEILHDTVTGPNR